MFCTNCGEEMRDADKFCAACGTPAAPPPSRRRNESSVQPAATPAPGVAETVGPAPVQHSTAEAFAAAVSQASSSTGNVPLRRIPVEPRPRVPEQASLSAAARMEPAQTSSEERQRSLLQEEELAVTRGMAPIDALPDIEPISSQSGPAQPDLPNLGLTVRCPSCDRVNPADSHYCESCGRQLQSADFQEAAVADASPSWLQDQQPVRRSEPAPTPPAQVGIIPDAFTAAAQPQRDSAFTYYYDDNVATKGSRTILYVLAAVLALGVIGVLYLLLRPSAKPAAGGHVTIRIMPTQAQVVAGNAFDFAATVGGTGKSEVIWAVQEGDAGGKLVDRGAQAHDGEVASMAVYVAPATVGTYHVVASSKADPAKSATAEVTVEAK